MNKPFKLIIQKPSIHPRRGLIFRTRSLHVMSPTLFDAAEEVSELFPDWEVSKGWPA